VKTISEKECRVLMKVIESYRKHVIATKGQTFIHYYGCHSVQLPMQEAWCAASQEEATAGGRDVEGVDDSAGKQKIYFVVMKNFLPTKMHMAFDLKGCTFKRRALNENQLSANLSGKVATLRDWEFMDIAMEVDIGAADKEEVISIIEADCRFLTESNLLDYSLLLGINRGNVHQSVPAFRRTKTAGPRGLNATMPRVAPSPCVSVPKGPTIKIPGGASECVEETCSYPSVDGRKIFFMGLVDILEESTCGWSTQSYALRCLLRLACMGDYADGITAMSPEAPRLIANWLRRPCESCGWFMSAV